QVERPWLKLGLAPIGGNLLVGLVDLFLRNVIAGLELRVAAIDHANVFNDSAVDNLSIRRFDESKFVVSREDREARAQTHVRTFRSLNGTDSAVVCRVHVAHFEPGALA